MPTTRSAIKQEPVDENMAAPSHPGYKEQNGTKPGPSTGSTVLNDDIDMVNGHSSLPEMSTFGELPQKLIKAIQKLDDLKIDSALSSLPKIVVVGDQSHGKSSVIEAICDISLPRSEGTCTRCPFQITTSGATSGDWTCTISLLRKYQYNPKARSKYAGWEDAGAQDIVTFAKVTDKSLLEHGLRLAQAAVLNPHRDPSEIQRLNDPNMPTKHSFSPNVIRLHIECKDLPELSMFDLPGAINVVESADEQHLVAFVETLIKDYVQDEKATVVLTVAASADINVSTAFKYITQEDALERTIGVVTKSDYVTNNRQQQYRRLLSGTEFRLGNGWFVTKLLSQEQLDEHVSHSEARELEKDFFANRQPWNHSLAAFSAKFGIFNLQDALSKKLTQHIVSELPEISSRIDSRLDQIEAELAEFPEEVKAPCLTVVTELETLRHALNKQLRGDTRDNEFRTSYRAILRGLRDQLKATKPVVSLGTPGYKAPAIISIDSEDDESSPVPTPSKTRKNNNGTPVSMPVRGTPALLRRRVPVKTEEAAPNVDQLKAAFNLDQLKHAFDGGSSGLPGQIDPKVTEHIVHQAIQGWSAMVDYALNRVQELMVLMLARTIEMTLSTRRQTQFFDDTTNAVEALFLKLLEKQKAVVENVVECETFKPITYSNDTLTQSKEKLKQSLVRERELRRINEHFDTLQGQGSKEVKREERKKKLREEGWVQNNLGSDQYRREVEGMATPIAYYDIASSRMLDTIANHLEYGLLYGLEKGLKATLLEELQADNPEHCAQLLAEDPHREELRAQLVAEKEKLLQAQEELHGLPNMK